MSSAHPPRAAVREAVARALAEDIGALGDLTASLIPVHQRATGAIVAREEGVLAGCAAATEVFHQVDPALEVRWQADDGHEVGPGQTLAHVEGPLASMLTAERTALNFLQHLSGVASTTRRWVRATQGKARIWDTRKTTPGLRALEKAAVRAGGGANHRGSLSDFVMVKDNHLTGLSIEQAVARARLLNRVSLGWNVVEGVVAVVAGLAAGSVSLVGFGIDSGIEVAGLGGRPGVRSARWAAEPVSALLAELREVDGEGRWARYVCELVCFAPEGSELRGRGTLEGHVAEEPRGSEGFGYDPIFVPEGETQTVAELGKAWKAEHSHRARAARALFAAF